MALADDIIEGATAAAAELGFPPRRIYRMVESNLIPFKRVGTRLYFRRSELARAFSSEAPENVVPEAAP